MDKNSEKDFEIKVKALDFEEQQYNNFSSGLEDYSEYKFEEKKLDTFYDQYSKNYNNSAKETDEEQLVQVSFEKPDEKITQKFSLFAAVLFVIVALPVMYHNLKDYIGVNKEQTVAQELKVNLKKFEKQDIYNVTESTGLITAESSVNVVARVEGYLQDTYIKEGQHVNKGQLLFQIEPNSYQIAVRASQASVDQARAIYENSLQELERAKELIKENFISRSDYDAIVATTNRDKAALDEVKQSLERAKLDLNYTRIYSPLDGKAGKIAQSNGSYVSLGSGALVNIAKTNPISVSFSMKSADVIKLKQMNGGVLDLSGAKVELILSDNSKYPILGKINFSDNFVAEDAATLSLKALFNNPHNILIPGDYVKVLVTPATPMKEFLIPQAITYGDSVNGYYVWTISENKTKKTPITVIGSKDNHWIVTSGISEKDNVIVKSSQTIEMEGVVVKIEDDSKK